MVALSFEVDVRQLLGFAEPFAADRDGRFDFSFSGLKTAVLRHVRARQAALGVTELPEAEVRDIAASFQRRVVETLVEMIELPRDVHPFFLGCQFHPEFRSRPTAPHPLFSAYIGAAIDYLRQKA